MDNNSVMESITLGSVADRLAGKIISMFRHDFSSAIHDGLKDYETKLRENLDDRLKSWEDQFCFGRDEGKGLLLPGGARFVIHRPDAVYYVIEQRPQTRMVFFSGPFMSAQQINRHGPKGQNEKMKRRFRLAFPYVVFIAGMSYDRLTDPVLYAFFRKEPLRSLNDRLLQAALPDVEDDGFVCLPAEVRASYESKKNMTCAAVAESLVASFWQSRFADDVHNNLDWPAFGDKRFRSLWDWERLSQDDLNFGLQVKWKQERVDVDNKEVFATIQRVIKIDMDNNLDSLVSSLRADIDTMGTEIISKMIGFVREVPVRGDNLWDDGTLVFRKWIFEELSAEIRKVAIRAVNEAMSKAGLTKKRKRAKRKKH